MRPGNPCRIRVKPITWRQLIEEERADQLEPDTTPLKKHTATQEGLDGRFRDLNSSVQPLTAWSATHVYIGTFEHDDFLGLGVWRVASAPRGITRSSRAGTGKSHTR